jgi:competence protein ComEA
MGGKKMARRAGPFLAGILIGLLAAGLVWLLIAEPRGEPIRLDPAPTPPPLRVYVSGAVLHPGVYSFSDGAIVEEALAAAGGSLPEADLGRLNLAAALEDGAQVRVPSMTQPAPGTQAAAADPPPSGLLNLNTATAPELELLPGIGPALAQSIVAYRDAHGPFNDIEDLLDVPGIGPAKLETIRGFVTAE